MKVLSVAPARDVQTAAAPARDGRWRCKIAPGMNARERDSHRVSARERDSHQKSKVGGYCAGRGWNGDSLRCQYETGIISSDITCFLFPTQPELKGPARVHMDMVDICADIRPNYYVNSQRFTICAKTHVHTHTHIHSRMAPGEGEF